MPSIKHTWAVESEQVNVRLPEKLAKRLDTYVESRYSSRSQVLREALLEFLEKQQPEIDDATH